MHVPHSKCQIAQRLLWVAVAALPAAACNSLDEPGPKDQVVVVPTDVRAAQLTAAPPAPISGGTLAVSSDGKLAVAADPDRDRVSVVDLDTKAVQHVALEPGDEPGRVALDDSGHAYVALRRGGAVAVIDLASGGLQQRVPVCAAPRGIALDTEAQQLHVACVDGRLISVAAADPSQPMAASAKIVREVQVGLDLRDVLLRNGASGRELWVSSFKRVELTRLGADGQVLERVAPPNVSVTDFTKTTAPFGAQTMQPHIAYRTVTDGAGNLFVLHQAESTREVAIDQPSEGGDQGSPYGSSGGCSGIITPAITSVDPQGRIKTLPVNSGVLSVDMAASPVSGAIMVVQAGATDASAPVRQTIFDVESTGFSSISTSGPALVSPGTAVSDGTTTRVSKFEWSNAGDDCGFGGLLALGGQSTAVAYQPHAQATPTPTLVGQDLGDWVVQSREPARLTVLSYRGAGGALTTTVIELGGDSVRDTGHDLFHLDAGAGVACASCHAEGAEDGHVWNFTRLGMRRTQALHVGLEGTAPFHWAGDESDLNHLMSDVFVGRMGGVHQSEPRVAALTRWLFALQPPAAPKVVDDSAVERGRALFQSPEVGCTSCHSGDKLTNNRTVDVGTGEALQVPSLRGIAYRAPYMHNGCALTLQERFSGVCGGSAHGHTSGLQPAEVEDLVAYLRTL